MDKPVIDEAAIRAYLMGRIGPEEEMSTQVDERMLVDPEFSLLIDVIEDEILEDYVDGALTAADIAAVESHFLTPPERQNKLRRMRLINHRITRLAANEHTARTELHPRSGSPNPGRILIFPRVRSWARVAAALALVSCTIYFWNQQRQLRLAVEQSRHELADLKQAQAAEPLFAAQGAVVTLNLAVPGLNRGKQALPEIHLPPGATILHISVALTAQPTDRLSIRLQQGDLVVWSNDGVEARLVPGGAVFAVDLPTAVVREGLCRLIVNVPGRSDISYWFDARMAP